MKLRTGYENRKARVEMLPLIDVVFLLLVFFIYAMLSMVHRGLKVDLPTAGLAQLDTQQYLNITITADNRIQLDGTETTLEALIPQVSDRLIAMGTETPLYIEGDTAADLGVAITILDRLQAAGIEKVSFTCKQDSQP
jgi:biopolymer transport protein ExbD